MILGYILIGVTVGVFGAAASLVAGASIGSMLGVYTLSGFAGIIVMSVARVVAGQFTARKVPKAKADLQGTSHIDEQSVPVPTPRHVPEGSFTILAVDDDPFILDLVNTVAEAAGDIIVVMAPSGPEALTLLADTDKTFDYLLFDVSMPQMSGIELCHRVRLMPAYQDVPIVMLTARRDMSHIAEAFRAGATDYATKPFDVIALRRRFQTAREVFEANVHASEPADILSPARQWATANRIDHPALSNYMTLLSEQDAAEVQIFAVKIDRMDFFRVRYAPARVAHLLDAVAAATAASLETQGTMMAFSADNDLLVVTSAKSPIDLPRIEALVTQCVRDSGLDAQRLESRDDDAWCGVSIGNPVALSGATSQRASRAITRALKAAEARVLSKHAPPAPPLTQASGV